MKLLLHYVVYSISFRWKDRKVHQKLLTALQIQNIFFRGTHFILLVCHKNLLRSKICFFLTLLSSLYARCFEWLGNKILFYHLSCHNRIHEHDRNICLQQPTSHILLGLVGFARNQLPGGFPQKISKK